MEWYEIIIGIAGWIIGFLIWTKFVQKSKNNVMWLYFSCKLRNCIFSVKISALRNIILILADILQLNKTTVIASCGCFRKII